MATQEIINYGAAANDGTGDPLRDAFIKVDNNFTAIWEAGAVGSNITITDNTVAVTNTNGNLILAPNGIGIVQINTHALPKSNNTQNLGSTSLYWRTAYIGSGGITTSGNLEANAVYTNNYFYANGSPFVSGGLPGGSNTQVQFNDSGVFGGNAGLIFNKVSQSLTALGNISGSYFIGNGSQLTGIVSDATRIINGNTEVAINGSGGNVQFQINGVANVVRVSQTQLFVNGVISTPTTLAANIDIESNVSAMMVSPLTIPSGLNINVPGTSTFNIVP